MNEKGFENSLKDALKKHWPGGHYAKIASSWMGGILDIYAKPPLLPAAWIELKFVRLHDLKQQPVSFNLNLSGQQREWIKKEHRAGGVAGWMVMVQVDKVNTITLSGTDAACKEIATSALLERGQRGRMYARTEEQWRQLIGAIYERQ